MSGLFFSARAILAGPAAPQVADAEHWALASLPLPPGLDLLIDAPRLAVHERDAASPVPAAMDAAVRPRARRPCAVDEQKCDGRLEKCTADLQATGTEGRATGVYR